MSFCRVMLLSVICIGEQSYDACHADLFYRHIMHASVSRVPGKLTSFYTQDDNRR
jgi:hypothetical protein